MWRRMLQKYDMYIESKLYKFKFLKKWIIINLV